MSAKAIDWARKSPVKKNQRYVLIELAMLASEQDGAHIAWPSSKCLAENTGLDLKTVKQCIVDLIAKGLLVDTGSRVGRTGQVRVLRIPVELTVFKEAENGTVKQTQKRNDSKNGTIPFPDANEPENGSLNEPENGTGNKLGNKLRINDSTAREGKQDLPEYTPPASSHKKTYRQLNLLAIPDSFKQEVRKRNQVSDERLEAEFIKFDTYWLKDKVSGVANTDHDWACQFAGQVRANLLEKPDDTIQAELHVQEVLRQQQQRRMEHVQRKANALTPEQGRQYIRQLRKTMAGVPHGTA